MCYREIMVIGSGQNSTFPVLHPDPFHFGTVGKGPSVVSQVNPWLGIERVFGVSGDAEEFVESVVGRAVQNRLGEIDVLEIKLVGRFAMAVVEIHADMVFPDSGGDVTVPFQHLGKSRQRAVNHRPVRTVREPTLLL